MLPVGDPPPSDIWRGEGSQGGSYATVGAGLAGRQKGTIRYTQEHAPPYHAGDIGKDAPGMEPGAGQMGPYHAMGGMLCGVLWFPKVGGIDGAGVW